MWVMRRLEGWALPCGCRPALGERRRKWTSPRGVRGGGDSWAQRPWGQRMGRDHWVHPLGGSGHWGGSRVRQGPAETSPALSRKQPRSRQPRRGPPSYLCCFLGRQSQSSSAEGLGQRDMVDPSNLKCQCSDVEKHYLAYDSTGPVWSDLSRDSKAFCPQLGGPYTCGQLDGQLRAGCSEGLL